MKRSIMLVFVSMIMLSSFGQKQFVDFWNIKIGHTSVEEVKGIARANGFKGETENKNRLEYTIFYEGLEGSMFVTFDQVKKKINNVAFFIYGNDSLAIASVKEDFFQKAKMRYCKYKMSRVMSKEENGIRSYYVFQKGKLNVSFHDFYEGTTYGFTMIKQKNSKKVQRLEACTMSVGNVPKKVVQKQNKINH